MKVIYIAGPFRGKTAWEVEKNIRAAEEIGFEIAQLGAIPLIPHTLYRFFNGELTDQFWLDATMGLLKRSDAIYMLPRWPYSSGSRAEKEYAEGKMPVFADLKSLQLWLDQPGDGSSS